MRTILITTAIVVLSQAAMAETFSLNSKVSKVTTYPDGAQVTRMVLLDIPAGQHRLLIGDVPDGFVNETLRFSGGEGLVIGALGLRDDRLPPDEREVVEREAIQKQIDALKDQIRGMENTRASETLVINAARARIAFLEGLGGQQASGAGAALENKSLSVDTLLKMVDFVGMETLRALQDAHAAEILIADINREIDEMHKELAKLRQKRDAIALPLADRVIVSLDVTAEEAVSGSLQLSYTTWEAGWLPVYDLRLDQSADSVSIERQAMLHQETGETWDGVEMTVSTARPNLRLDPGDLQPQLAYLHDPYVIMREATGGIAMTAAPSMELMVADAQIKAVRPPVTLDFQGLTAIYHLPDPISLDGDGADVLFAIDTSEFEAELTARATPLLDSNAYLFANLTNETAAPYLPGSASFYRDGAYIGRSDNFPMIAAGENIDLAFGVIDGISTERTTLFRETGEAGILTTSNDKFEQYRLEVENLTAQDWNVILYDRAPYSEEEDLEIKVSALPMPSKVDVDGKRGIYSWEIELPAGETKEVSFEYTLGWPKDKELGYR